MAVNRVISFVLLSFVGAALVAAPIELKVTGDRVNLRARPEAEAEVAGQVSSNEILFAPEGVVPGAEWVKVRPPETVDLWIFSALVTDGVVNADDTYVRCGPGQHFKFVGKVHKGDHVERRGALNGDWMRIAPVGSAELFINTRYVEVVEKEQVLEVPAEEKSESGTQDSEVAAEERKSDGESSNLQLPSEPLEAQVTDVEPLPAIPSIGNVIGNEVQSPAETLDAEEPRVQNIELPTSNAEPLVSRVPPRELGQFHISDSSCQDVEATLSGRLERRSSSVLSGGARYQLVERSGYSTPVVVCHVVGLTGQWRELVGSEVEIRGRLWTLSDDPVPVIYAESALRTASWEK